MDFELPETAQMVRDGVAAVAAKYDNAYWSRCEEEHRFPDEIFADLGKGGWLGLSIPEVARRLGYNPSSIRKLSCRIVNRLQRQMAVDLEPPAGPRKE